MGIVADESATSLSTVQGIFGDRVDPQPGPVSYAALLSDEQAWRVLPDASSCALSGDRNVIFIMASARVAA